MCFKKITIQISRMYQESLKEVSIAILLHESHRSYPSRRRACFLLGIVGRKLREGEHFVGKERAGWFKLDRLGLDSRQDKSSLDKSSQFGTCQIKLHFCAQSFLDVNFFGPCMFFGSKTFVDKKLWTKIFSLTPKKSTLSKLAFEKAKWNWGTQRPSYRKSTKGCREPQCC